MQDRRSFIHAMLASAGAAAAFTPAIARALAVPADRRTGTLQDVAHVVILTQENRSFDHYFGTMRGVSGYGDRFAIPAPPLPEAPDRTVLLQPNEHPGAEPALIAPFRLDTAVDFNLYRPLGTPHGFTDSQAAWDNGRMGAWPRAKQNHAMAHFTRADLPFQYALAEAFTLCDAYHSALHLCTNPNRLYIWTGTHDPLGEANGPAIDNGYDTIDADPQHHGGYLWTTYPERLAAAGIGFQIYQDMADNFTDNPLVGFHRYRTAQGAAGELLKRRTMTTRTLGGLRQDVLARQLPEVSWVVAPAALSEHPGASTPLQGADFTAQVLDALTADPAVWARTVLLINFDENDGLFDHVPPPAPPARVAGRTIGATTIAADDEYHFRSQDPADAAYLDRPYGLGPRVPLYVVSPWSRGGHVASEVFDHTSILRFLEARFGVHEPNISAWRRAVCGDLTSCFDFTTTGKVDFLPSLPATTALSERAAALKEVRPPMPAQPAAPVQETGGRRRRATPYALDAQLHRAGGAGGLSLINRSAERAAVFHVYDLARLDDVPARYTVGAGRELVHPLPAAGAVLDLFILGPNGFHRRLSGRSDVFSAGIVAPDMLSITNITTARRSITMTDRAYAAPTMVIDLAPGETRRISLDLTASHGWYDRQFAGSGQTWRIAGHLENGKPSWSDPASGGAGPLRIKSAMTVE
ncbi:phosphocholine-specific phospholipase C [Sphingomonas sp. 8AM]|uniref:phosphocholine-specific phospholipase C n=1 Tax=Sphingomonas sp. 8AM TaxID=2653170 RepID=UPI0012F3E31F|nr:phospholipase C, phosphocholine-specific [Sphingomonas sp. 8AM]VXC93203.1 Non-hemolytic phospholipase C [Sphingomonas sp. 8AM]